MTHSRAYVHACAFGLLPLVGAAGAFGGVTLAGTTWMAGLVVLGHLLLGEVVVRRFVAAAAARADGAGWMLLAHQLTGLPVGLLLVATLGVAPVALAYASLLVGAVVQAVVSHLHDADAAALARASTEAAC